jgi:FkbM family methyltransferase
MSVHIVAAAGSKPTAGEADHMPLVTCNIVRGDAQPTQMRLELDPGRLNESSILQCLQAGALFEADVSNVLLKVLRDGDVAVDVGANIGFLTVLSSILVGPTGRVVAFEPDAENLVRLRANLAHNDCQNVTIIEKAVTNQVGEVEFFINAGNSGGNAIWNIGEWPRYLEMHGTPTRVAIPATTLDAEWERLALPAPKAIKIDVEGAEQRVLEGARELLARHEPPFIVAELHPFGLEQLGCSQESLRGYIEGLGYSTFSLTYAGTLPRLVPPATRIEISAIINMLFSKPEWVGPYWPAVLIDGK